MEQTKFLLEPKPRVLTGGGGSQVFLTVKIGNGQIGGNHVTANNHVLAKGKLDSAHFIGNTADLEGKTIQVVTNVLDVNAFTDLCVITTIFTDEMGNKLYYKTDQGTAPTGGVASFIGTYKL